MDGIAGNHAGRNGARRAAGASQRPASSVEPVNLLLVDDRSENLVTLGAILDQPDLRLVHARSGKEALRCVLKEEFAVILLDVNMPGMDGFETASIIRQRKSTAHTPIIFVTAYSDEAHIFKGYSLGAVDYILTPVDAEVLRAKVAVFVELFRKTQEVQRQSQMLRELEAVEHRRELNETTERLNLALEAGHMGAWEWDLGSKLMSWSPMLERIFGLQEGEFTGTADELRSRLHPDDRENVLSTMIAAATDDGEFRMEHRIVRPSGEIAWVELRGRRFADRRGVGHRLAGVCMDITERKRAEEELVNHRNRLEDVVTERTDALRASQERLRRSERLASLGTLAAGIAHEINNPINAILLSAQYVLETLDEPMDAEAVGETLHNIVHEAKRCGNIVKNILKFAREEATPKALFPLNDLVQRAAMLANTYVESHGLHITVEPDPRVPALMLNATQIEQVLINLIQNAAQAANGPVEVVLRTEVAGEHVRLLVRDNGPGIPEHRLPHIFDPFYSTRQNRGGTGLGLSIAHNIVTEHGGTVDVRSRVGHGTCFTLSLPIPSATPVEAEVPQVAMQE